MKLDEVPLTFLLAGLLVVIFIAQLATEGSNADITTKLMLKPAAVMQGQELWGLFTNMFLHGDLFHIMFNGLALVTFGLSLEAIIGRKNLLTVFLAAGLFASVFYVFTSVFILGSTTPALGASGAIFGVIGCMIVLRPHTKVIMMFAPVPVDLWIAGIFFVLIAVLWFSSGGGTGIAENAHLGGMVIGLLFGRHFKGKRKKDKDFTWNAVYAPKKSKDPYDWIDEYR